MFRLTFGILLSVVLTSAAFAQEATRLSASQRDEIQEEVARIVDENFFDEERAHAIAAELRDHDFSDVTTHEAFADAMGELLHAHDNHFSVRYVGPEVVAAVFAAQEHEGDGPAVDPFESSRRGNYGFNEVSILPGNIGYIRLLEFAPAEVAGDTAAAALDFIANTDAVIFDLRENTGGAPSMVQFLISHFLDPSESIAINTFVSRRLDYPQQLNSLTYHPSGFRPDVPVYVLVSGRTGSAGEAFPYHLQAMDRATIIGQTTYGAGNPGDTLALDAGYEIFISTSSAQNPITGTNWEGVGVEPDVATDPADALATAQIMALDDLAASADEGPMRDSYVWAAELLRVQTGELQVAVDNPQQYAGDYGPRHILLEGDQLFYRRETQTPRVLHALGDDRFLVDGLDNYRLTFQRNRRGQITSLTLRQVDGPPSVSPRD